MACIKIYMNTKSDYINELISHLFYGIIVSDEKARDIVKIKGERNADIASGFFRIFQ